MCVRANLELILEAPLVLLLLRQTIPLGFGLLVLYLVPRPYARNHASDSSPLSARTLSAAAAASITGRTGQRKCSAPHTGPGLSESPTGRREEAAEMPAAARSSQGSPGRVLLPRSDLEFLNRMCGEHPHSQYLSISSSKKRTFLFVRCTHTKCRHPASFHPLHSVMLQERVSARVGAGKTGRRQRGARTRTSSTGTSRSLPMSASNCACSAALADILCLPRRRRSHAPPPPSSGTRGLTEAREGVRERLSHSNRVEDAGRQL